MSHYRYSYQHTSSAYVVYTKWISDFLENVDCPTLRVPEAADMHANEWVRVTRGNQKHAAPQRASSQHGRTRIEVMSDNRNQLYAHLTATGDESGTNTIQILSLNSEHIVTRLQDVNKNGHLGNFPPT